MDTQSSATSAPIVPIVVGTAGHIDHGKSTLVQALTGTDPDRLKEERERGMTIDLGFACFELPDGRQVGIVDVPGHERFIKNMVAGASGIDLVMLVVAADDGVMPQTREHLSIMDLLGVRRGFVALSKVDLVDEEMALLAEEDVRDAIEGTFLEGCAILPVSATTGQGVDAIKAQLAELSASLEPRSAEGVFRMPVQRVFSARGFGTIVTGIPVSGRVKVGDVLEVAPGGQRGKVRGIQAYHSKTDEARAGHSTAINLADVDHKTVERGHVVASPGFFRPVQMVGARLRAITGLDWPIKNRTHVRLHTGTSEAIGELIVLDMEEIEPGAEALVQLRLEQPVVCAPGDRFVVRLASPAITLGGGVVVEESRYRLKRFKSFVIEELGRQADSLSSVSGLLESHLARAAERWLPIEDLAYKVKLERAEVRGLLDTLVSGGTIARVGPAGNPKWIHGHVLESSLRELHGTIGTWFEANPLRGRIDVRDLRSAMKHDAAFLTMLLDEAARRDELTLEAGGGVRVKGRTVALDDETGAQARRVLELLRVARFQPPALADLIAPDFDEARLRALLHYLVDEGQVVRIGGDVHFERECIDEARRAVIENCEANGQLEIPELRDRLGTSRKYLIPLLEYFDASGVTLRQAGHRVLKRR
ncbi:MAG: selenocysteine-specific elongation factor [Chlamydiales bacterium]